MTEPDILSLIDGAIEDYAVSGDAMRWTPDGGQKRTGSPWIATDEAHTFTFNSADAQPTRISIGGVDVTPYVSRVGFRGAEPSMTVIDETHIWTTGESGETAAERIGRFAAHAFGDDWREANPPRGLITAAPTVPQPAPVTAESVMAAYRAITEAQPQPQRYVCSADEYERIKADLDARGVDVELTASPYVPTGTVMRLGPAVQADTDYRIDYHATFDRDLASYRQAYLQRPLTPTRIAGLFDVPAYMVARPRPRRAKLRAIHTAYRAKTRRRNRRTR